MECSAVAVIGNVSATIEGRSSLLVAWATDASPQRVGFRVQYGTTKYLLNIYTMSI